MLHSGRPKEVVKRSSFSGSKTPTVSAIKTAQQNRGVLVLGSRRNSLTPINGYCDRGMDGGGAECVFAPTS